MVFFLFFIYFPRVIYAVLSVNARTRQYKKHWRLKYSMSVIVEGAGSKITAKLHGMECRATEILPYKEICFPPCCFAVTSQSQLFCSCFPIWESMHALRVWIASLITFSLRCFFCVVPYKCYCKAGIRWNFISKTVGFLLM